MTFRHLRFSSVDCTKMHAEIEHLNLKIWGD